MNRFQTIAILLFIFTGTIRAQEILTLSDAVNITLEKNFDIRVAALDTIISSNNATAGNAGLLPSVYANGNYDFNKNDTNLEIAMFNNDGSQSVTPISVNGAETEIFSAGVVAEYTLFDGLGGYHRLDLLKNLDDATRLQTQLQIENTVLNTVILYLNVATQQENLAISEEQLAISAERLNRAESRFNFGAGNRTTVLNARADVKNDSVALRQNQLRYKIAKNDLNTLMGRAPSLDYRVSSEVTFFPLSTKAALEEQVINNNTALRISNEGLEIAQTDLKVQKAERFPKVFVNGGYNYLDQTNDAGQLLSQQLNGWNVGVGLRLNIFDGNRVNRNIQNAQIGIEQNELQQEKVELQIRRDFENAYTEYLQSVEDLRIETSNLETFQQNFERSQIDYQNGQITNTQLRDAQLDLTNAKFRIVTARYQVKQLETRVLQLTGSMLMALQ
ncbi:TolC family protein [Croceiramulus getboli]|nr:TolC family protein [Flavobacteriaceae bacterium YJPT1-3]